MKEQLIQFLATLPLEDRALNAIMQAVNTIEDESYRQGYSYGMDVANSINEHAGIPYETQIRNTPFNHDIALADNVNGYVNKDAA